MTLRANVKDYGAYGDALRDDWYGWATCAAAILAAGGGTMVIDGTPRLRTSLNLQGVNIEALPGTRATADGGVTVTGTGVLDLQEPFATVLAGAGTWNLTGRQAVAGGTTPVGAVPVSVGPANAAGASATAAAADHVHSIASGYVGVSQLAAGAALTLYSQTVLGAGAAAINITPLPTAGYHDLLLVATLRGDAAGTSDTVNIRLNADTGANYDTIRQLTTGTAVTVPEDVYGATAVHAGSMPTATAPASVAGTFVLWLPGYALATFQKAMTLSTSWKVGTTAGSLFLVEAAGFWRNAAAVTQIGLIAGVGNFIAGSSVSIYLA